MTIVAAWSGFSASEWGTESSLNRAKASATRTKANRAFQQAQTFRVGDATTFNAWVRAGGGLLVFAAVQILQLPAPP